MRGSPAENRDVWDVKKLLEVTAGLPASRGACPVSSDPQLTWPVLIVDSSLMCLSSSSVLTLQTELPTCAWLICSPTRTWTRGPWVWPM